MTTVSHVSEKIDSDSTESVGAGIGGLQRSNFLSANIRFFTGKENSDVAGVLNDRRWDMDFVKKFPQKEMNTHSC